MKKERIINALKGRKSAKLVGREIDLLGILETQKKYLVKEAVGPYFDFMVLGTIYFLNSFGQSF